MKKIKLALMLVSFGLLAVGCASQPLMFPSAEKLKNTKYEVLGPGVGESTGLMLFGVIPIGQNERFVRAYEAAVKSKGGDALIDQTIEEHWFWAYVLDGYSTKISGTVIKFQQ